MCGTNNSCRHLHQSLLVCTGSQRAPSFAPFLVFTRILCHLVEKWGKNQKSKTIVYSIDVWALICRRHLAAKAPTQRSICLIGTPKMCQLEKFYKMVHCGSRKAAELPKSVKGRIQDGGRRSSF